jgi:hypothetical protein
MQIIQNIKINFIEIPLRFQINESGTIFIAPLYIITLRISSVQMEHLKTS